MSVYVLVVDDEPDVEALFRQQFRRDLKAERFKMEFAPSAHEALVCAAGIKDPSLILILSDINAIVEESLNLAYHGARAEKSGFNITLKRELDPAAGMIDLYPQEITRVFLNLISNGFYAATKRKEAGEEGFEPTLIATTKDLGNKVEIRIRDNGTGIPPEVREKMFNPFFTTKPAGEGTGLGLSMSHDIIVKQHGGKIDVDTRQGSFTEFIITLPRAAAALTQGGGRN